MNLQAKVELITPDIAKEYLMLNKHNYRALNAKTVEKYAKDMRNGNWVFNGEAIQFDADGFLVNGQHRLSAIVKSGTSQLILVVRGVETYVFDIGRLRNFAQIAKSNGFTASSSIGGAVEIIMSGFNRTNTNTPQGVFSYYEAHNPELFDTCAKISTRGTSHGIMKKSACIAAIYCALSLGTLTEEECDAFCRIANTGVSDVGTIGNAPQILRRQLQNTYKQAARERKEIFEITWQALNDFKNKVSRKRDYSPNNKGNEIIKKVKMGFLGI